MRTWLRSAVVIAGATLLLLAAAEMLARWGKDAALRRDGLLPEPSRTALSGLSATQWADYDRLAVTQLKPYVDFAPPANYRSATVNTNERGFRGGPVANPKPPGRRRVVVLGGSAAFGVGASSDEATFPARLQAVLRARGGRDLEVVNAGAPAYVSGQELARLIFEVVDLEPDVVIVYDGFNDLNSPLIFDARPGYPSNFAWRERTAHFNSFRQLLSYRIQLGLQSSGVGFWARRLRGVPDGAVPAAPALDAEIIETYRRNLDRMVLLAQARGIRTVCVFQPTLLTRQGRPAPWIPAALRWSPPTGGRGDAPGGRDPPGGVRGSVGSVRHDDRDDLHRCRARHRPRQRADRRAPRAGDGDASLSGGRARCA